MRVDASELPQRWVDGFCILGEAGPHSQNAAPAEAQTQARAGGRGLGEGCLGARGLGAAGLGTGGWRLAFSPWKADSTGISQSKKPQRLSCL